MGVDPKLDALANAAPNFGYLLTHEPLLISYGAAAEASVYTDPNTAMVKCRQFGEALTARAFIQFGIPKMPDKQFQRLKLLSDQGFVTARVHRWFDDVRRIGNRATHEDHAAQRDALLLVRACYELGAWFHETVTGRRDAPPFVAPQPPGTGPQSGTAPELRQLLDRYRAELVEMKASVAEHQVHAEAAAQAAADAAVRQAVEAQADLRTLVTELAGKVADLQQQLTTRAERAAPIDAALRDRYVEQAAVASRPRLTEAQTRRIIDRMLVAAGWVVQDRADTNVHAAQGVAVREVPTADGRADYLLYVDAALVGAIEAKREGMSLVGSTSRRPGTPSTSTPGSGSRPGARHSRSGTSRRRPTPGSPTRSIRSPAHAGCSRSTGRRRSHAGCARPTPITMPRRSGPGCAISPS